MWSKLKEQLPTILLTALLITGAAFWLHQRTVSEMAARAQAEITPLREQNDALKAASEENRRQIEATNKLLKDAIAKRQADMFMTDEEINKLNADKINALAEAVAKKVQPYNPLPKTPEEAERMQNEQVDKVSSRMAEKIQPILAEMANDQHLTRDSIAAYSQKISDQVGVVLTSELAKNQQLNNNLQATQAVAQDALKLSHEITALYLSSFKDQGLITRLLTLPANVVKDAASLSIVSSSERKKVEGDLINRMNDIDKRLAEIQAQAPKK
ncbi:MAG TPA: hypothetical protein PLU52_01555 [Opitutaceae bacterium]|nr:hypothetical protein [Opitutaceae bacterium]HND60460.1 hypothetical protein [Opitutaceae bacterium]